MKNRRPSSEGDVEAARSTDRTGKPLWLILAGDVILAALILCVFFLFHSVIPTLSRPEPPAQPEAVGVYVGEPALTPHFSSSVVRTENSYSSPDISVKMSTLTAGPDGSEVTYHVADIHIANTENFQTYFATGEFDFYAGEPSLLIDKNSSAIVAINGDYCNTQKSGLLVRNGELLMTGHTTCDICVLYRDGTLETYGPDEYTEKEILAGDPWQIWKFGPKLLDENGRPCESFNTSKVILGENPRSGLGYYEPGHYCFVVVDGRQKDYSEGLTMTDFAGLFADLGCVRAYNMDGGDSAVMTFDDMIYSRPSGGGRSLGDILLIRELEDTEELR